MPDVKHPKVAVETGALTGDRQDGMGINGGDGGVDDLKITPGKTPLKQHLQKSRHAERRLGIALRRRLAKHEHAGCAGRLFAAQQCRLRCPRECRRQKAPRELCVLDQRAVFVVRRGDKKRSGMPVTGQAESALGQPQQQRRHTEHQREAQQPSAT